MNGPAFLQEAQGRLRYGLHGVGEKSFGPRFQCPEGVPALLQQKEVGLSSPCRQPLSVVHRDGGIVPAVGDQHPAWVVANGGFDVEPVLIGGEVLVEGPVVVEPLARSVVDDLATARGLPGLELLPCGKAGSEVGHGSPGHEGVDTGLLLFAQCLVRFSSGQTGDAPAPAVSDDGQGHRGGALGFLGASRRAQGAEDVSGFVELPGIGVGREGVEIGEFRGA